MMPMLRVIACILPGFVMCLGAWATWAAQPASVEKSESRTKAVFAVSWQAGFCETRPERPECKGQMPDRFDATHFTLHGLWPVRKTYCGVDAALKTQDRKGKWLELPRPELGEKTAATLIAAMPGVESGLDRHQWLRSGRCHSKTAEAYFDVQMRYLDVLNRSGVRELFVEKLGQRITEQEVRQAFDVSFGRGAGERVRLHCAKAGERTVVTGLTIGLGDGEKPFAVAADGGAAGQGADAPDGGAELSRFILAADATHGKCPEGVVDRAGRL